MNTTPENTSTPPARRWTVEVSDRVEYEGWVLAVDEETANEVASDLVAEGGTLRSDLGELTVARLDREVEVNRDRAEANHLVQAAASLDGTGGGKAFCTYGNCDNPKHDHTTPVDARGDDLPEPVAMLCNHCRLPSHYDEDLGDYQHDNPDTPDCFLIQRVDPSERGR